MEHGEKGKKMTAKKERINPKQKRKRNRKKETDAKQWNNV